MAFWFSLVAVTTVTPYHACHADMGRQARRVPGSAHAADMACAGQSSDQMLEQRWRAVKAAGEQAAGLGADQA